MSADQRQGGIAWTDETWNFLAAYDLQTMDGKRGWACEKVSPGCFNCYAETLNKRRGTGLPFTVKSMGEVATRLTNIDAPLRWQRPRRIFTESMTDLFGQWVPDEQIDQALAVMLLSPRHTFQTLTKRADRMRAYLSDPKLYDRVLRRCDEFRVARPKLAGVGVSDPAKFPASWIHWGVSVENQEWANKRIPDLLATPAAVRFVSYEPAIGPVRFDNGESSWLSCDGKRPEPEVDCCEAFATGGEHFHGVDWVIVGGESGPGARPFDVAWARDVVRQCREAGIACFVKQLGARPVVPCSLDLRDRKGGDPSEWPEDLRVREFPRAAA